MVQTLTGSVFGQMVINAAAMIEENKQLINELNVFPVPDGDTGTNMCLTLRAGAAELEKTPRPAIGDAAAATANALLRGARGNSGVILSLLFRGMAKSLKEQKEADTKAFAAALNEGVSAAYKAVMKPTEGTILTVSRLAAEAATVIAEEMDDFIPFLERIIAVGEGALENTVNQNPVLKKAGVVDAGGKGYLCILNGMLMALKGEFVQPTQPSDVKEKANFSDFETENITFMYCTEFIVSRDNYKSPAVLRDYLNGMGDSLVVVDDDEIIKVHVHTNEPGKVITEALTYGSLLTVKIENMREQHTAKVVEETNAAPEVEEEEEAAVAEAEKEFGFVAVSAGEGMASLFSELGVDGIITGGQTMNPSTQDILKQINRTPAETVFVLPNNKNIIMAAEQCVDIAEKKVIIIPSKTVPQGVSAMLSVDASQTEEEITAAMEDAISHVHTALVTYAARDSEFDGRSIKAGEYLALLEGKLLANSADFSEVLSAITAELKGFEPELITVFYGEDVDEAAASAAADKITADLPEAEISTVNGGQPVYYYMISAE